MKNQEAEKIKLIAKIKLIEVTLKAEKDLINSGVYNQDELAKVNNIINAIEDLIETKTDNI